MTRDFGVDNKAEFEQSAAALLALKMSFQLKNNCV
jgi:hypothetical protein